MRFVPDYLRRAVTHSDDVREASGPALSGRFESSSGEIAYGSLGEGPDVVLVHGTPSSSVVWRQVAARLADDYRLHVLDLPGYGQSARFEGQDVRLRALAKALAGWLSHMELDGPVLVGHDFGSRSPPGREESRPSDRDQRWSGALAMGNRLFQTCKGA